MIVSVDLLREPARVRFDRAVDTSTIVVRARGGGARHELNRALAAAGAGCVPDHHAELRVAWVRAQLAGSQPEPGRQPERPAGWLLHADDDLEWVAAPIQWQTG